MRLQDPLGLVLRQAALELVAAVDAVAARRAQLGHAGAAQTRAPDSLRGAEEWRQHADGIQDLQRAGRDRRGRCLAVRALLALAEPRVDPVAGKLGGGEQPGRARADDLDVLSHHSISLGSQRSRPRGLVGGHVLPCAT